ncbi:1406_t:CDS:2 [Diversispora eburnea]|uniref:1406_t:CDS:1 n=1 Tax=Diversispora eburnea TaxID=1213867 RepID=A0A9N8ZE23_9GLOM|nr:1406_t:CDS:2 [Diversispora eburnea]
MEKIEITQEKEKINFEEIILDVGGTKYKTKRSTLIEYPNTLLGKMFLNPSNYNKEYFLDRNERAFHYIMEFYRTGKPLWPDGHDGVTCEEVEREFEYFQIPLEKDYANTLAFKAAANTFDQIVSAFEKVIISMYQDFDNMIYLNFFENGTSDYKGFQRIFSSLGGKEYILLTIMGAQIKRKLENTFSESKLKWEYKKVESFLLDTFQVKISYDINPVLIMKYSKFQ